MHQDVGGTLILHLQKDQLCGLGHCLDGLFEVVEPPKG
jgi:hypothetical protein